jgi:hypothetical protein
MFGGLMSGKWFYDLRERFSPRVLVKNGPVTGFAFGPGRKEIAYCAPVRGVAGPGLWVLSVLHCWDGAPEFPCVPYSVENVDGRLGQGEEWWSQGAAPMRAPRLVWAAPAGVALGGPVWWAPDGSHIAVRAVGDETSDLVAVNYATGVASWISRGTTVVDAAWERGAGRLAYVTREGDERTVWVQTLPPSEPVRLGTGGYSLRWSPADGLSWLGPGSAGLWTQMTWDAQTQDIVESNPRATRPAGSLWSPDGRLCAALEEAAGDARHLVIYAGRSEEGEVVTAPDLRLQQLLGWSPDSRVVMVLTETGLPVAVAAYPATDQLEHLSRRSEWTDRWLRWRACVAAGPVDVGAGPPEWSSDHDMIAYVPAAGMDARLMGTWRDRHSSGRRPTAAELPNGSLVAYRVVRRNLVQENREPNLIVYENLKLLLAALEEYANDHNGLSPPTDDIDELCRVLRRYGVTKGVFTRPGSSTDVVVQYLLEPGTRLDELDAPHTVAVAVVDYDPQWSAVAFSGGWAKLYDLSRAEEAYIFAEIARTGRMPGGGRAVP